MAREVELKLEIAPEDAEALLACDILPAGPRVVNQRSVYFDTPARDLAAAGFTLRIRTAGERRTQTVKAAGTAAAGLFARPEWEFEAKDDTPVLDDTTPVRTLLGDRCRDIGPVFAVAVERRIWDLDHDGARIELVLDRGDVVAGDRRSPICEVELELKDGRPGALYALARRIDEVAPLRIGILNKAERGWRLLGPTVGAAKAEPIELSADVTVASAFRSIAAACLRQFRLNEPLVAQRDVEAVHQARVALRRLLSALSVFKPILADDGAYSRMRQETRWLAGALGDARDLDVQIGRAADEAARETLLRARTAAYAAAVAALASRRARMLMLDLSEWLTLGAWQAMPGTGGHRDLPAGPFATAVLERARRKVKKGGRDLAELDDDARHAVRKDAKTLRYAAEFFASLFTGKRSRRRQKRFLHALEDLQAHLGALNDLAVANTVLERVGLEPDDAGPPADEKRALVEAAAEAHDAFADTRPFWR